MSKMLTARCAGAFSFVAIGSPVRAFATDPPDVGVSLAQPPAKIAAAS